MLSAAKASTKIEDKENFILVGFSTLEASVDFARSVSLYAIERRERELTAVSGVLRWVEAVGSSDVRSLRQQTRCAQKAKGGKQLKERRVT